CPGRQLAPARACTRGGDGLRLPRVRPRLPVLFFAAFLAAGAVGCRPPDILPPYAAGQAPAPAELLGSAAPKVSALQVPLAKIKVGRAPSGNLMFLAQ